ncbi:hypothetical protein R6Z07F_011040 [Ovis aries]
MGNFFKAAVTEQFGSKQLRSWAGEVVSALFWGRWLEKDVGCHCPPSFKIFPRSPSIKWFDPSGGVRCCVSRRAAFEPPPRLRVAPGVRLQRQRTCSRITGVVCPRGCGPFNRERHGRPGLPGRGIQGSGEDVGGPVVSYFL